MPGARGAAEDSMLESVGKFTHSELLDLITARLHLQHLHRPPRRRVGLVSRRVKRFLLNEDVLIGEVMSMGLEVQVLPLERMTLYEQVAALKSTTVLVGVHGSGLNNVLFLPGGAAMIQLLPYKLNYKGAFGGLAKDNQIAYFEWALTDRDAAVFHWHFLGHCARLCKLVWLRLFACGRIE